MRVSVPRAHLPTVTNAPPIISIPPFHTHTHTHSAAYEELLQVFGSDPTWGLAGVLAKTFNCAPIDVTAREELLLDPPRQRR